MTTGDNTAATVPDEALEAAAEAFRQAFWASDTPNDQALVRVVIEAAMPAIREALAQEIEAEGRGVVEWLAAHAEDATDRARLIGTEDAYKHAIRIVNQEPVSIYDLIEGDKP